MDEPKPNQVYRHFKGGEYRIICIAQDCENPQQKVVVYEMLYDKSPYMKGTIWVRNIKDFCGFKDIKGRKIKRFQLLSK